MLERLECSVVQLSRVDTGTIRFDSEYYSKSNIKLEKIIAKKKGKTVGEHKGIVDCSAFYPSITGFYSDDRSLVPFLRVNEISNGLVVLTDKTVFLPQKVLDDNPTTISVAYPGDIIIAKGGNTLAKVGLVTDEYPMYATCRDVIILVKSIEPGSDAYLSEGVPFYRVADVSKEGLKEPDIFLDEKKYYNEELSFKKDMILFSKDGSIGIAYKIEEDMKAISSGALLHFILKDKSVLADYLTLVLNSRVVGMQAERDAGGSIIQHWRPEEIEKVLIPIADDKIQRKITEVIKESFRLRAESKALLEKAKKSVELAIETSEKKAVDLLNLTLEC